MVVNESSSSSVSQGLLDRLESLITNSTQSQSFQVEASVEQISNLRSVVVVPSDHTTPDSDVDAESEDESEDEINSSLWNDLLRVATDLDFEQDSDPYPPPSKPKQPQPAATTATTTSSSTATKLLNHLRITFQDEGLHQSMSDDIIQMLASKKGPDEISIALAELIGFEQLELVTEIMQDRSNVARELEGIGEPSSLEPQPLPHSDSHFPDHQSKPQDSRLRPTSKPYTPGSSLVIQTAEELVLAKKQRSEQRRLHRQQNLISQGDHQYTASELEQIRLQSLEEAANRPLFSHEGVSTSEPSYPHVFSSTATGNVLSSFGQKFALPSGTTRVEKAFYEEVTIPPPKQVPFRLTERLVPIREMDALSRGAFPGYKSLNRLQSVVFPLGYGSNENLLVCAPTGAGKTDVAMLTVLRAIKQHCRNPEGLAGGAADGFGIMKDDFKIVYVAPMKALAAEIVRKFSKRLAYLGIKVRELTGDMQLTRQEIAETQMIVTTPEKWDVVTRKPTGEGELATKVKLLIIDEVHLLHEDRGAVIETIVARTLRLVESSQSLIRIVGLSATLPNYVDVSDFLRVNRYQGLFYFDSSFRPVPLEQHFLGVKGKAGSQLSKTNLDKATFEKCEQLIKDGHQVMVFVHARKETVKTAMALKEMFHSEGMDEFLTGTSNDNEDGGGGAGGKRKVPSKSIDHFRKDLQASRNKEMKELAESGFGIHHAGMLRSDRNLSERMFESGVTKVLCCTATLAWGVNLPAFAVLIKGTEVYDSSVGKFVNLSILDVLQIFGRAGRPQYEDLGVGYILTNADKLSHYVDAITSQHPIESKFIKGLIDSLNGEISLGTVTSIKDGISWLGYTYLFTRMKRNPLSYGMPHDEVLDDPHLGSKRLQLINNGIKALVEAKMLDFDAINEKLNVTDLGRIAARYYVSHRTIEIFNEKLKPQMREADVLGVLSLATDFEQIIPRDAEEKELKKMEENAPCDVAGGASTSAGKVNILLQAHISRTFIEDFALVSDSAYVAQNAARIIRALTEIALSRKWAPVTASLMAMSKAVERRIWPFDHPLSQSNLNPDTIFNITRWADEVEVSTLAKMSASEIATLIHSNDRIGGFVLSAAKQFPSLSLSFSLRPITSDILRIEVSVERNFEWNEKTNGGMEPFYVWVEDSQGLDILQWSQLHLRPQTTKTDLMFDIQIPESIEGVSIRWISDRWIGAEDTVWISFDDLVMPDLPQNHLELLDLPLLSSEILKNTLIDQDQLRNFMAFNAIQTQCLHTLMFSSADTLLCAPMSSGKTTVAELAILRTAKEPGQISILVVHPRYLSARRHADSFRSKSKSSHLSVYLASSPRDISERRSEVEVIFTTPQVLLRALMMSSSSLDRFQLVLAEDLHLLSSVCELALSRLIRSKTPSLRLVATSSSLQDASSLSSWLSIKPSSVYSFHPKDRPSPLQLSFQGFDLPHSLNLLKTMVKPAYDKIKVTSSKGPTIIFLPSRAQCRQVASDLVRSSAADIDSDPLMGGTSPEQIEPYLSILNDGNLFEPLQHGIGVYHDGMSKRDQNLIMEMFESGLIRVLIAPREATSTLQVKAHLVIIMSTQFIKIVPVESKSKDNVSMPLVDRKVTDYDVTDLVELESFALRKGTQSQPNPPGECLVLCQSSQISYIQRMMTTGLPLESTLFEDEFQNLFKNVLEEVKTGNLKKKVDLLDYLSWTYLYRSLERNPSYYDCLSKQMEDRSTLLSNVVDQVMAKLVGVGCLLEGEDGSLEITSLANSISSEMVPDLINLQEKALSHSAYAVEMMQAVEKRSSRNPASKEKISEDETGILQAIRSTISSDLLSSWSISKGGKKLNINGKTPTSNGAAPASSSAPESGHNSGTDGTLEEPVSVILSEFSAPQKRALLLASFFSSKALLAPQEYEALKSKYKKGSPSTLLGKDSLKSSLKRMEQDRVKLVLELLEIVKEKSYSSGWNGRSGGRR